MFLLFLRGIIGVARAAPHPFHAPLSTPIASSGIRVAAAVECDFFEPFANWVFMFTRAVGVEASYFDGCYCHQDILTNSSTGYKRRRAMIEQSGSPKCPWKGKRLAPLAMGYIHDALRRVKAARTPKYTDALLHAPAPVANRIAIINEAQKDIFIAEIRPMLAYAETTPWKIAGAFSAYVGYSLQDAKDCVGDCFDEFRKVSDPSQHHFVSLQLFSDGTHFAGELWGFRTSPSTTFGTTHWLLSKCKSELFVETANAMRREYTLA